MIPDSWRLAALPRTMRRLEPTTAKASGVVETCVAFRSFTMRRVLSNSQTITAEQWQEELAWRCREHFDEKLQYKFRRIPNDSCKWRVGVYGDKKLLKVFKMKYQQWQREFVQEIIAGKRGRAEIGSRPGIAIATVTSRSAWAWR